MDDQETERSQIQALEERLREWLSSQGGQIQGLTRQLQEQAGNMWQEFEKRIQALDDARQALEDRIGRQIDNLLAQQRSFARKMEAAAQPRTAKARTTTRKAATKKTSARPSARRTTAKKSAARKSGGRKSTAKKSTARKSTAKRS